MARNESIDIRVAFARLEMMADVYAAMEDVQKTDAPMPQWMTDLDPQLPEADLADIWNAYKVIEDGGFEATYQLANGLDAHEVVAPEVEVPAGLDLGLEIILLESTLLVGVAHELEERGMKGLRVRTSSASVDYGSQDFNLFSSFYFETWYRDCLVRFRLNGLSPTARGWNEDIQEVDGGLTRAKDFIDERPQLGGGTYGLHFITGLGDSVEIGQIRGAWYVDADDEVAVRGAKGGTLAVKLHPDRMTWEDFDAAMGAYKLAGLDELRTLPNPKSFGAKSAGYIGGFEDYTYGVKANGNITITGFRHHGAQKIGTFEYDRETFTLVTKPE